MIDVICPNCNHDGTRVIDSRPGDDGKNVRRRRECPNCDFRFTTFERMVETAINVVKRDGSSEEFNRDKLLRGIIRACEKRPISREEMEQVVFNVEQTIRKEGNKEISSKAVGDLVMANLLQVDEVAYIRFASVYKQFDDIETFVNEVQEVEKKRSELEKTN